MNTQNEILVQLDRLAAGLPLDTVEIDVKRAPSGAISYSVWVRTNDDFGWPGVAGIDDNIEVAVTTALSRAGNRDPVAGKAAKLAALRAQVAQMENEVKS
jgi:hypothetical protein